MERESKKEWKEKESNHGKRKKVIMEREINK